LTYRSCSSAAVRRIGRLSVWRHGHSAEWHHRRGAFFHADMDSILRCMPPVLIGPAMYGKYLSLYATCTLLQLVAPREARAGARVVLAWLCLDDRVGSSPSVGHCRGRRGVSARHNYTSHNTDRQSAVERKRAVEEGSVGESYCWVVWPRSGSGKTPVAHGPRSP
jgi:hypothetical protein